MFDGFFEGKRILLTGDTGFKGAWLALWLARLGAVVGGYALESPTEPSLYVLAGVEQDVRRLGGDVRDLHALTAAVSAFAPDIVIHMAAQSLVRPSYEDPAGTFETNIMGTVHLLESVRRSPGAEAVLIVTSDKCYANDELGRPFVESDPMGGHDPYSASKGCAELATESYTRSFFFAGRTSVASVRAGNVIGGGDFARDRLIPDLVRAATSGTRARIRNPRAVRPWQHVLDLLTGYLLLVKGLCEKGRALQGGWNFGPAKDEVHSVDEVARQFCAGWGPDVACETDAWAAPHEAGCLRLDPARAARELGWAPRLAFREGLAWTLAWYKAASSGQDPRRLTLGQIERYENLP
ncbi:CDP-glucose 4,6-dehydratase [Desulfovibrio aminophilus]|uniref:CDP-glucose 4,6-dehydratase n=1 Tax=Desulfovibrio aminophilus TaxID=81425 RepID=UPI0004295089|nr:CDP-glucose 4,6-dehydratase [Desulfovibrio aminophilus]